MNSSAGIRLGIAWGLALVAGLGWWTLRGESRSSVSRIDTTPLARAIPLDRVESLIIERADGRRLDLRRTVLGWEQVEPFPVGLDAYAVRQIISTAQALGVVDSITLDGSGDAERLGLDPPVATITYRWPDGEQVIALGNRTLAGRAWARIGRDADEAVLVDASLHEKTLENDPRFLRDRTLAPFVGTETNRIFVRTATGTLALDRTDRGWRLSEPVRTRGDEAAIADWLARVARTRVSGYLHDAPDRLDRFGLAEPVALLELENGDPAGSRTIRIGDPIGVGSEDRYALVEGRPTVVRIDVETQKVLVPSAASLIDGTGTDVVREDVASIEVRRGEETITLKRDFDGWAGRVDSGPPQPVDRDAVEQLLGQLTEARAEAVLLREFPESMAHAMVILYGFDGGPLDTVRIALDPRGGNWALENGDRVLRVFDASFELPLSAVSFGLESGS